VSVTVGFGAVTASVILSSIIGVTSGYFGGKLDMMIERIVDAWMSIPTLVVLLTIVAILGPSLLTVLIAIGFAQSGGSSRVKRSAVLAIKENTYREAARVIGASHPRIIARYVLPNIFPVILITASVQLGSVILLESSLSFLGYGVPPPHPSWGSMLSGQERTFMLRQPWLALWPGLAIFLVVYSFNMLGDAIRDLIDPQLRGARGGRM
jgi:peptide/nickel transport system permease protein